MSFLRSPCLPALAALAALLPTGCDAARKPRLRLTVKPSEAIETRVGEEVAKAANVLLRLEPDHLFDSPYVVSALYYHDGFFDGYPEDRADAEPSRRILSHVAKLFPPDVKRRYTQLLHEACQGVPPSEGRQPVQPVLHFETRKPRRGTHKYAIDLFVREGSAVRSVTYGIVLLAEENWDRGDPFSTSSPEGGNAVIIFNPREDRFYRYCHLASVKVAAGTIVQAGGSIGAVGHSGFNASRRGHGGHLHFEINEYDGSKVRPFTNRRLREIVRGYGMG